MDTREKRVKFSEKDTESSGSYPMCVSAELWDWKEVACGVGVMCFCVRVEGYGLKVGIYKP